MDSLRKQILQALKSSDRDIRKSAIEELANSSIEDRYQILNRMLAIEKNPLLRSAIEEILKSADTFDDSTTKAAVQSLDPKQKKILQALRSDNPELVKKAFVHNVRNGSMEFLKTMRSIEHANPLPFYKICNIRLLTRLKDAGTVEIAPYTKDEDLNVAQSALEGLARIGTKKAAQICLETIMDERAVVGKKAAQVLTQLGNSMLIPLIVSGAESMESRVRIATACAIGVLKLQNEAVIDALEILIGDEDKEITHKAWESLDRLASLGSQRAKNIQLGVGSQSEAHRQLKQRRQKLYDKKHGASESQIKQHCDRLNEAEKHSELAIMLQRVPFQEGSSEALSSILKDYLQHPDDRVRANAVEGVAELKSGNYLEEITPLLEDSNNRVVGNVIVALCESPNFNDHYYGQAYSAMEKLVNHTGVNPNLTAIFCCSLAQEERWLSLMKKLFNHTNELVSQRAHQMLENWAQSSTFVRDELREWRSSYQVNLEEDDLDEFMD